MIVRSKFNSSFPLVFHAQRRKGKRKKETQTTDDNQVSYSVCARYTSFLSYFILIRVLKERTTLRIAVCGGLRRTRLGQLVFCLLERRRAKPERSPSSSSDVQGTTPREDVACINSWSGPFRCSYNKMFNVSSYIRASGNSTWKYICYPIVCYTILISSIEHCIVVCIAWCYFCVFLISCIDDRMAADFCHFTTMSVKCPTANLTWTDDIFDE